ncbi:MAG: cyanoexosortase B system-associated protein [Oculatellaceae cyanobacterium Prado106]|jgi:cyanoexosortase B-associated protein|nr:cyanoexosortase B system-associated protein [Oculatellaceae cyanobacterium Prado106]
MLSLPSRSSPWFKAAIVLFMLAIAAITAIPNYFTGQWVWQRVPGIENLEQLKTLQQKGLMIPGWESLDQGIWEMGGHKWSVQAIAPQADAETTTLQTATILMLRPQTRIKDLPQVDWVDINGTQRWTADSLRSVKFSTSALQDAPAVEVQARFLRGWSQNRTYAVLQWYAWADGGHSAPSRWFWVDQWGQLRDRRRVPWVAVSLLVPIEPLGDITTHQTQIEALGQLVQTTLMQTAL